MLKRSVVILMLIGLVAVAGVSLAAEPTVTLLETGSLDPGLDEGFIFWVIDVSIEANETAVGPHEHSGSMFYAEGSPIVLGLENESLTLAPGEARWLGEGVPHRHGSDGTTAARFVAFTPAPPSRKGMVQAVPGFQNGRVVFESQTLTFAAPGTQEVMLERYEFQPNDDSGLQQLAAPTLFRVESGIFHITLDWRIADDAGRRLLGAWRGD